MNQLIKELTDQAGDLPQSKPARLTGWQLWLKYLIPIIFSLVLIIPGYTYFVVSQAGQTLFGPDVAADQRFYTLFRLFGLYAFVFIWGQVILGPFMVPLGKMYGKNWFYFHRMQGIFALLLAMIHPSILYVAYIIRTGHFAWLKPVTDYTDLAIWAWLGVAACIIIIATVASALLMKNPWMRTKWHWIHSFIKLRRIRFGVGAQLCIRNGSADISDVDLVSIFCLNFYFSLSVSTLAAGSIGA